jgi:hypothetical protein
LRHAAIRTLSVLGHVGGGSSLLAQTRHTSKQIYSSFRKCIRSKVVLEEEKVDRYYCDRPNEQCHGSNRSSSWQRRVQDHRSTPWRPCHRCRSSRSLCLVAPWLASPILLIILCAEHVAWSVHVETGSKNRKQFCFFGTKTKRSHNANIIRWTISDRTDTIACCSKTNHIDKKRMLSVVRS